MTDFGSRNTDQKRETVFRILAPCVIGAFFCFLFLRFGVGQYPDSLTYLTYHSQREPLYPLFLKVCRLMAGEAHFLQAAALIQNVLAFFSFWYLYAFLTRQFQWNDLFRAAALIIILAPQLLTSVFTPSGIVLTNAVLSEGLTVSLYPLFVVLLLEAFYRERKGRFLILSYITALLLSLARGQLMTMLLVWFVIVAASFVRGRVTAGGKASEGQGERDKQDSQQRDVGLRSEGSRAARKQDVGGPAKRARTGRACIGIVAALLAATAFGFVIRQAVVQWYHAANTDGVVRTNTGGNVTLLTNVLYSAGEEAVAAAEESLSAEDAAYLHEIYVRMKEQGLCASDAGGGFHARILHHEDSHDKIKFTILGELLPQRVWDDWSALPKELVPDGRLLSVEEDHVAGRLMKAVLPHSAGSFLRTYFYVAAGGFVRTVSLLKPLLSVYALLIYLVAAALMCYLFKRAGSRDGAWFMAAVLLMTAANVCATALTIMCLSRYMIYNMTLFYLAGLVCVWEVVRAEGLKRKGKRGCVGIDNLHNDTL